MSQQEKQVLKIVGTSTKIKLGQRKVLVFCKIRIVGGRFERRSI